MVKLQAKNGFPDPPQFRVGTTSYIYPAGLVQNVLKLKNRVDDVELVLFDTETASNIPGRGDLKTLARIGSDWDISYTAHMPLDIDLGSAAVPRRKKAVARFRAFLEYFSCIEPYAYIGHLNWPEDEQRDPAAWQARVRESLDSVLEGRPEIAGLIAIENLSYPFEYAGGLARERGLAVCVDIGHLILRGADPLAHIDNYFDSMRVMHLHGVRGTRDHVSLRHLDTGLARKIFSRLKMRGYRGVVTLEVFSKAEFDQSLKVLMEVAGP